jgi:hypothetical protein
MGHPVLLADWDSVAVFVVAVFFAAGAKEDADKEDDNNDGNNKEWRIDAHRNRLLALNRLAETAVSQ